jgi:hypothetical protein
MVRTKTLGEGVPLKLLRAKPRGAAFLFCPAHPSLVLGIAAQQKRFYFVKALPVRMACHDGLFPAPVRRNYGVFAVPVGPSPPMVSRSDQPGSRKRRMMTAMLLQL